MLNSINPLFDNIEFKEFMDDTGDLFLTDLERQDNITQVDSTYEESNGNNLVYGTRNNLLFIHQYHEVYKRQGSAPANSTLAEIEKYRRAILAMQCGDWQNSEVLVDRLASGEGS
jgi:hypothetical protein